MFTFPKLKLKARYYALVPAALLLVILLVESSSWLTRKAKYLSACWGRDHWLENMEWSPNEGAEDECDCEGAAKEHPGSDRCYRFSRASTLPDSASSSWHGRPFDCAKVKFALKKFPKLSLPGDSSLQPPNNFTFVTAASDNHFVELQRLVGNLELIFKSSPSANLLKLVIYSLDLNFENVQTLQDSFDWVTIRDFPFRDYPISTARNLYTYQWKIFLLAEIVNEFEQVFWLDTSVILSGGSERYISKLVATSVDQPATKRDGAYNVTQDDVTDLKDAVKLFLNPRHSILAATHPALYAYFPTDKDAIRHQVMYATGLVYLRWSLAVRTIMQWAVVCALHTQCIAPAGSVIQCHWNKTNNQWVSDYSCCHRFDQSLLNLLLANHFAFDSSLYYSNELSFTIRRDFFNY